MKLLADECVDERIVQGLRAAGCDVVSAKSDLRGVTDENLLQAARAARRTLITEDKDFGHLAVGQRLVSHGVILIRARGFPAETIVAHWWGRSLVGARSWTGCIWWLTASGRGFDSLPVLDRRDPGARIQTAQAGSR